MTRIVRQHPETGHIAKPRLSSEDRIKLVNLHQQGKSTKQLSLTFKISIRTVRSILKRFRDQNRVDLKSPPGRPRLKSTSRTCRHVDRLVGRETSIASWKISVQLLEGGLKISSRTIRRIRRETGRIPVKEAVRCHMKQSHFDARIQFATTQLSDSYLYKKYHYIWTDECKVLLTDAKYARIHFLKPGDIRPLKLVTNNITGVMIWAGISWRGTLQIRFINESMNSVRYIQMLEGRTGHEEVDKLRGRDRIALPGRDCNIPTGWRKVSYFRLFRVHAEHSP